MGKENSKINVEKLADLRKHRFELIDTTKSLTADVCVITDEISRLEARLPHIERNSNEMDWLRKQIADSNEKKTELQRRYSEASDDVQALIQLVNSCEVFLESRGISVPADTYSPRSTTFYHS